jgi:transaldolase
MSTQLQVLRAGTIIGVETLDLDLLRRLPADDTLVDPSLALQAVATKEGAECLDDVLVWARSHHAVPSRVADRLMVAFGIAAATIVPRRVTSVIDATLAFDRAGMVAKAGEVLAEYERNGIARERVLIGLPATWEGIEATGDLQSQGIDGHVMQVASLVQAAAAAEAKAFLVSVDMSDEDAAATSNQPRIALAASIARYYACHAIDTALGATGLREVADVAALAALDRLSLKPDLFARLAAETGSIADLPAAAPTEVPDRMILDEKTFRFMLNEDAPASLALGAAIRRGVKQLAALRTFAARRLEARLDPFADALAGDLL